MAMEVDEMGNCWAVGDTERTEPVEPHPELDGAKAKCPSGKHYRYRVRLSESEFQWRCACGEVFEDFHH